MLQLIKMFEGYKTYISAIGLIGLGIYQLSTGDYANAMQTVLGALGLAGLRNAIKK